MTVYVDIIFLENLCMNYIILFATGLIGKSKIKQIRLMLSSILGSVYAILTFSSILKSFSGLIIKVLLSIGMVYLAYKPFNIKKLFKMLLVFYLTSFVFGGCAFALLYFVKPEEIFMKDGLFIGTYPIKIALLGGIVGFSLVITTFKIVKSKISKNDMFCDIVVHLNGKSSKVKAMIDTGNLLKDPISRIPVIVVEKEMIEGLVPKNILDHTEDIIVGKENDILEELENSNWIAKFRMIPFTSLGKQHGLLLGIKADKVEIFYEDSELEITSVIIGVYDKPLSKAKNYQALVGLEILGEEEQKNERFGGIKI